MTGEEGEDERKERAEPMLDARCSMLPFIDLDGLSRPTRAVENGGILPDLCSVVHDRNNNSVLFDF